MYIFDTSSFIQIGNFYPNLFPTLWGLFNDLVQNEIVLSVKPVLAELEDQNDRILDWATEHKHIFLKPTSEEGSFIAEIFMIQHFQQLISQQNRLKGKNVADPFVALGCGMLLW